MCFIEEAGLALPLRSQPKRTQPDGKSLRNILMQLGNLKSSHQWSNFEFHKTPTAQQILHLFAHHAAFLRLPIQ